MNQERQDLDRVQEVLDSLSEHFDTVQIFCTRHEMGTDEGTVNLSKGIGNWFARRGQVAEWILKEDEGSRISVREED